MANAPVSATNTAKPGNPNAQAAAPAEQPQAAPGDGKPVAPAGANAFGYNSWTGKPYASQAEADAGEAAGDPEKQAAAPAEQPAQQKMDPNKAAELKGRLKAGQGVGQTAGGGFKNYVAGSQEKFQGADASGAPVFKKLQREGAYGFESKFFGGLI
jgi:hypothetical protein